MRGLGRWAVGVAALTTACVGGVPSGDDTGESPPPFVRLAAGSGAGPPIALTEEAPSGSYEVSFAAPAAVVDPGRTTSRFVIDVALGADDVPVVAEATRCGEGPPYDRQGDVARAGGTVLVLRGEGLFGGCAAGRSCTRSVCVVVAADGSGAVEGTWFAHAEIRGPGAEDEATIEVAFGP